MNIFALDDDVTKCAEYHVDRHVVKMILEYSQLLSTAHRVLDGKQSTTVTKTNRRTTTWRLEDDRESILYKATHINHPSALWARASSGNYTWLKNLLVALCAEYTYRYGRVHRCESIGLVKKLEQLPNNIKHGERVPVFLAMPPQHYNVDSILAYRDYYRNGKQHLHIWKGKIAGRETPPWL